MKQLSLWSFTPAGPLAAKDLKSLPSIGRTTQRDLRLIKGIRELSILFVSDNGSFMPLKLKAKIGEAGKGDKLNQKLPSPIVNADSKVYWDGAREDRLMIRRCKNCGEKHFLPRHLCPSCWSEDLEWIQSSGRGIVHSYTVIRRTPMEAFRSRIPYIVALIDLEEGPRMMANVIGETALETKIGDLVEVCFEDRQDGAKVPQFRRLKA